MNKKIISYKSSDNTNMIKSYVFYPDGEIKAVLQIAHGMSEHFLRYEEFIEYMVSRGFAVCGNNHLGHGKRRIENIGFMGQKDGWLFMVKDMHTLNNHVSEMFPNKPYYMLGHSLGSFLARIYAEKWGYSLSGLILSGTGNLRRVPWIFSCFVIFLLSIVQALNMGNRKAYFLDNIMNKVFNIAFLEDRKDEPLNKRRTNWQTSDHKKADDFLSDPLCNIVFTYSGYKDIITLMNIVSRSYAPYLFPKSLPILLFSGEDDPLGNYSKGVLQLFNKYKKADIKDITVKIFEGGRHEMLNEVNREEVYDYVNSWINKRL